MYPNKQRGFSLVEAMVTVVVFAIGAIGITLFTTNGIKTTATNQIRSQAIKATSVATEPLVYNTRPDCLESMLLSAYPQTVVADGGKDTYTVKFARAVDGRGQVIATDNGSGGASISIPSASWSSPVSITLVTPYQGIMGVVSGYTSYSIILQNYTLGCNA